MGCSSRSPMDRVASATRASRAIIRPRRLPIPTNCDSAAAVERHGCLTTPAHTGLPMLVYFFGNGKAEGTREMRDVLGGKGANLAEMTNLGVPVPPGFTIACSVCVEYLQRGTFPES